jgi:heptosyltransferase-2
VDLALILPNSIETALWARVCGARWRIGYAGDGRTPLLTHAVVPPTDPVHQVDQYLRLLAPLGVTDVPRVPRLGVAAGRLAEARRLLADVRLRPADRPVGIALGAALGPAKLWPARRYGELAGRLEGHGIPTVFLGTGAARPLLEEIVAARPEAPRSLVGRDGPDLLPALLHEVALLIGADSGPVHLAAAVGTPVLTLFGPTDPRLTAPRGAPGEALWRQPACGPCFLARCPIDHRCLEALEVEEVLSAALRLHGGAP